MLEEWGWRWFVGICSIPVLLALAAFRMMPESPHWLLTQHRHTEALRVVQRIARLNGQPALPDDTMLVLGGDVLVLSVPNPMWALDSPPPPPQPSDGSAAAADGESAGGGGGGTSEPITGAASAATEARKRALEDAETAWQVQKARRVGYASAVRYGDDGGGGGRGGTAAPVVSQSPFELFHPGLRWVTARLFVIWFAFAFAYYGVLLILPEVLSGDKDGIDYTALLISSCAEVVACCIGMAMIDRVGRSRTAGVCVCVCVCVCVRVCVCVCVMLVVVVVMVTW
jgi:hypothetical protein